MTRSRDEVENKREGIKRVIYLGATNPPIHSLHRNLVRQILLLWLPHPIPIDIFLRRLTVLTSLLKDALEYRYNLDWLDKVWERYRPDTNVVRLDSSRSLRYQWS